MMRSIMLMCMWSLVTLNGWGQTELKPEFDKAVQSLKSENFQKAVTGFSGVLNKATDSTLQKFCYIYRAFSYNGLLKYNEAIQDLDKAVALDPGDLASYTDRGKTKAYANKLEEARSDFLFILTKDSTDTQGQAALYYLAKIEYQLRNMPGSIKYYDKLILLLPGDAELYFNLGAAKGSMLNPAEAIKDYDQAIRIDPKYREAYANRGVEKINLLTTKGNIQPTKDQTADACLDLRKALQLGDKSVEDMIFIHCEKK
jgi:tetratricopeptide (TPR) repeat protein